MTAMPRAPRKPKPDSATETARVLRVFDMLAEEMASRFAKSNGYRGVPEEAIPPLLEVADRIAARTEDPA